MIDWKELQETVLRTAKRAARRLYDFDEYQTAIQELLHVGIIAVIDRGAYLAPHNVQRTVARRAIWDYGIRQKSPATLPQDSQYRTKAFQSLDLLFVHSGAGLSQAEPTQLALEIKRALQRMSPRAQRMWLASMMGYSTKEIALQQGYTPRSVSTLMSNEKKKLHLPEYWKTKQKRGAQ